MQVQVSTKHSALVWHHHCYSSATLSHPFIHSRIGASCLSLRMLSQHGNTHVLSSGRLSTRAKQVKLGSNTPSSTNQTISASREARSKLNKRGFCIRGKSGAEFGADHGFSCWVVA